MFCQQLKSAASNVKQLQSRLNVGKVWIILLENPKSAGLSIFTAKQPFNLAAMWFNYELL